MKWTWHQETWFGWIFPRGKIISRCLGSGAPLQCSAFHLSELALERKGLVECKSYATKQTPVCRLWRYKKYFFHLEEKVFNSDFNSSTLIYLHTHTVLIYTNILMCMCEHIHVQKHTHTHTLRQVSRNLSLPLLGITVVLIFRYLTLLLIYCSYPSIMLGLFDHVFNRTFIWGISKSPGEQQAVSFHWNSTLIFEVLSWYIIVHMYICMGFHRCGRGWP